MGIHLTQVSALARHWWGGPRDRAGRLVPLPEAEAGASERARAPALRSTVNCVNLSEVDTPLNANKNGD
jgi:hypothetical protein